MSKSSAARRAVLLLACLLVPACEGVHRVQIPVENESLAGLYWEPSKNLSPGVLLAPAPGEVKEGWIALATRLRQQGYGVLALDPRPRGANDAEPLLADLRAGVSFLRQQKKIDAARIGLIGSTRAANAALCFAAKEPLLRFAVAISPGLDGGDLAAEPALRDYGFRPLLLVAAENDQASRGAVERLAASAQAGAVAKIYPGNAHGTQLLGSGASLADDIVVFLRAQL